MRGTKGALGGTTQPSHLQMQVHLDFILAGQKVGRCPRRVYKEIKTRVESEGGERVREILSADEREPLTHRLVLQHKEPGYHCFITLSLGVSRQKYITEGTGWQGRFMVLMWAGLRQAGQTVPLLAAETGCKHSYHPQAAQSWRTVSAVGKYHGQKEGIGLSANTPKKGGRFSSSRLETSQGLLLGCGKETLTGLRFRVIGYCAGLCGTVRGCVELSTVPKGKFDLRIRLKAGNLAKGTHMTHWKL